MFLSHGSGTIEENNVQHGGDGTRALGFCLAEKTLKGRMRGEGLDEDAKEACVEVPVNFEKKRDKDLKSNLL